MMIRDSGFFSWAILYIPSFVVKFTGVGKQAKTVFVRNKML